MSKARPPRLSARWDKRENDILISYPRSCDGHLLYSALCHGFDGGVALVDELQARGYDITTLRFSVVRPARREP
jgi:hypothetical protein